MDATEFQALVVRWREDHPGEGLPYHLFEQGMTILEREIRGPNLEELCEDA